MSEGNLQKRLNCMPKTSFYPVQRVHSRYWTPSAREIHSEMKAESYSTWALTVAPFGRELTLWSSYSLLHAPLIHPPLCLCRIQRGSEQTTCFREESWTGSIPDQSTSSSPAPPPPASLSSTLSLGTGLDDFCWMAALCWGRMGARG